MIWILLVLFYGLAKGGREICKKKALTKNTVIEVLFFYTLLSFLFVTPEIPKAGGLEGIQYGLIALKAFVVFLAWICSFNAIKMMPVSLMGVLDLSRVIFATLFGVLFLHEQMTHSSVIGLMLVSLGLVLLPFPNIIANRRNLGDEKIEHTKPIYIILALISCVLNAVSGTMDKYLMGTDMSSGQLQFWYMLFLVLFYIIYIAVKRIRINYNSLAKNYWIWILAVLFVLADRALFIANGYPESKVTIMTLVKQAGCLVTIVGGKLFFKEKNILYKLFCAMVIITGIMTSVI